LKVWSGERADDLLLDRRGGADRQQRWLVRFGPGAAGRAAFHAGERRAGALAGVALTITAGFAQCRLERLGSLGAVRAMQRQGALDHGSQLAAHARVQLADFGQRGAAGGARQPVLGDGASEGGIKRRAQRLDV
jgi:hypothetical protein